MPNHRVLPRYVVLSDLPNLDAIRADARSLDLSVVQLAEKHTIDVWTAVCITSDALSYRIRHLRQLPPDDTGWKF